MYVAVIYTLLFPCHSASCSLEMRSMKAIGRKRSSVCFPVVLGFCCTKVVVLCGKVRLALPIVGCGFVSIVLVSGWVF